LYQLADARHFVDAFGNCDLSLLFQTFAFVTYFRPACTYTCFSAPYRPRWPNLCIASDVSGASDRLATFLTTRQFKDCCQSHSSMFSKIELVTQWCGRSTLRRHTTMIRSSMIISKNRARLHQSLRRETASTLRVRGIPMPVPTSVQP
jgi:hypothetical protein